jgi:hypothetical protein
LYDGSITSSGPAARDVEVVDRARSTVFFFADTPPPPLRSDEAIREDDGDEAVNPCTDSPQLRMNRRRDDFNRFIVTLGLECNK